MCSDKVRERKNCFDCSFYNERTSGTGYCSEWDTIVDFDDICIEEIEKEALEKFKNRNSKR